MSDAGGNFMPDKFIKFCKKLNIEYTALSSYHHCCNGQVEACIKFMKQTLKKYSDTNLDT